MVRQASGHVWGGVSTEGLTEEKDPLWKWVALSLGLGDMMKWNKGRGLSQQNECFSLACLTVDHTSHLPPQDSAYVNGTTKLWIEPSETMRQDRRFFSFHFFSGIVILAMQKWLTVHLHSLGLCDIRVTRQSPSQPRLVGYKSDQNVQPHSLGLWDIRVTKQPPAAERHRVLTSWGGRISCSISFFGHFHYQFGFCRCEEICSGRGWEASMIILYHNNPISS